MNVRRLAAVDMHGLRGTRLRRRIILVEFVVGCPVILILGALFAVFSGGTGRLSGLWLVGMGLNYVPLAYHAIRLSRPGALDAALVGVDVDRELRRYGLLQFWLLVPLSLVVVQVLNRRDERRPRTPTGG